MTLTLALCSRNARPEKGLVRRPHIDQQECPSKRRKTSEFGRINWIGDGRLRRAVEDQSARNSEEKTSEFGRINSIGGGRLRRAGERGRQRFDSELCRATP